MTRSNLGEHIAWLLANGVTPVQAITSTNLTPTAGVVHGGRVEEEEEELEQDTPRPPPVPAQNRRLAPSVTVIQEFARPALPSTIVPKPQPQGSLGDNSMGKLSSASKSTRPGLLSQHQLATPASTSNSAAASSSLTKNYATFLRESNCTPSSRPATDRLQQRFPRSLQTPHTPRQTPRPTTKPKHEVVESVDLTGDDFGEIPVSRSSSSDVTCFGEPIVLWREDSASRAEPLVRTSRKRKSDEMSPKRLKKIDTIDVQLGKTRLDQHMSMEGFVDIDEMVLSQTQPKVTAFDPSRAKSLRPLPSIEKDIPEEYEITETISRVETRTRKTISRVPSVTEGSGSKSIPPVLPIPQLDRSGQTPSKARDPVQVAASSVSKPAKPPGRSSQTPQRGQKRQIQRTIQDSDEDEENDEEILSEVHKRASSSPSLSIKKSPRVIEGSTSPKMLEVSPFEAADIKVKDLRDSKPRIGSPLRPISRNVAVRQEKIPSPFQRDSPTKVSLLPEPPKEASSQHTPGSSLGLDEKKLVQLYLKQPSAVSVYQLRVKNSFNQNSIACMEYIDNEKDAPAHLKEERKTLLDMKNAYEALESLSERHRNLSMEKKSLYRKISELMELELDAGPQEERQLNLTQEIRKIEKEIGQLLHVSGAVRDGFGTGSQSEAIAKDIQRSSLKPENSAPLPSGSSTVGSAQIIWQTQIPHAHQQSVMRNNQRDRENLPSSPLLISDLGTSDGHQYQASPSPVRRPAPAGSFVEHGQSTRRKDDWTSPGKNLKQPNFYVDRSPVDYGFEGGDLDDLLRDEEELHQSSKFKQTVPEDIEDNYGDSDDDNDMLEIAQEVEKRQSLPEHAAIVPPRKPASDTSKSRSTSGKRTMYSHVDPALANMLNFPWSADVKKALRERFGLRGFRQNQLEAINATLSGKDAFILMPTGGGKSLCYQLPAIVQSGKTRGVTIVISPLLSLMNDQVTHLQKLHIQAFLVNGEKAQEERNLVYNALRGPYPDQFIQLLYITPEMIGKSDALLNVLAGLHEKGKLARIVVDEAHCVSQWGHDFRPDYKTISKVRMKFPGVPLIALTATATENVKADCIHNLGMEGCEEYKQSFNRPNLYYEIQSKKGKGATAEVLEKIASLIKNDYKNQTGIVYTLSRAGCEELAEKLRGRGIKAYHFHASMPPEEKNSTQRDWQSGKLQVVVATIAFGMGIDKPDVRFVIHHTLPKSLEGYYQETGRAGRDGKLSKCILFYGYQDTAVLKRFIDENEAASDDVKERQREMLNRMIQYCENRTDCRRADILSYFGESFAKEDCNHTCDNCNSDAMFEQQDMTNHATAALNMVKKLSSRNVTMVQVNDLLRGLNYAKIKDYHDVEGFGVAKDLPKGEVQRLLTRLVMERALEEYHVVNKSSFASQYIQLGPNCQQFLLGRRKLNLMVKVSGSPTTGPKKIIKKPVKKPRSTTNNPTSTMLTSPISLSSKRQQPKNRYFQDFDDEDFGNEDDDFVVPDEEESDEDAFEPVRGSTILRNRQQGRLGPPIITDERMKGLPEVHRICVQQFVDEAKKFEESLRNKNGHTKPYFTERDFREMAIDWTLTLEAMHDIPGIDSDKVNMYGRKFLQLVERYHSGYDDMMNSNNDQDIDQNHQNVIDLCSDEELVGEEDEDEDEEHLSQAEQPSKYFKPPAPPRAPDVQAFNGLMAQAQNLPQRSYAKPDPPKSMTKGGSRGKGKYRGAGRRGSGGRSTGPASGSSTGRSRGGQSNSRVSKASSRRSSGGSKRGSTAKSSNLTRTFGNHGGSSGTGGGGMGGIGMMPT